ncbi:MAG: UDP-N-acetylmuramate--L-alanine ligase [Eubacteriales bacterium]|nr:UDP-N-acetylmuramate--L-alanine ligase [Eubacteriales bacterium]
MNKSETIDDILKRVKRIHFIGIGGSGMCPLAEILISLGYKLSGSDNNDTETFRRIEKEGAKVHLGQVKENLTDDIELVIYTNAILAGNEELEYAKEHFPCFERAELLGAMSRIFTNCIGVCGTHGKTTTSSMITQILLEAGLDPSAVIGGKLPIIDAYGRYGHSQNFVCESCEFNNTFLHMNPDIAVILNIDEDHLDFFKNLDNIKKSFREFAEKTTKTIIYNGDDKNTVDTLKGITGKKLISIGKNDGNEWTAKNIDVPGGFHSSYDVYHNGKFITKVEISVPGEHNILNSLCAFVAAYESGADVESICRGLKAFGGAGRRFELLGTYKGITFADDYAHHPTELKVTLEAAMKMGYKRVWAVHQPFTYSRTSLLLDDFAEVLQIPDKCVISAIMGSREINTIGITAKDLADKVPGSIQLDTFDEICDYVLANAQEGDLVITLGCGDIYKAARMMVNKLK